VPGDGPLTAPPLGLTTLGDHLPGPDGGAGRVDEAARFRQFVELGVVGEELGFAALHLGEHHFSEYVLSSPTPILAAVGERTSRLRLSTAVSLLPHHDPVRVAEDYATVDVLSGGRVELLAGRGVFREHYAHFGQDPADSEELLVEAVALLRQLWTTTDVRWSGRLRPPLDGVTVHPRPVQRPHPPIVLSATSPSSVQRAVALGCPIAIATVSTGPDLPVELVRAYRAGWAAAGRDPAEAQVLLHVHAYVGDGTSAAAADTWMPHQTAYLRWVLDQVRGPSTPMPAAWTAATGPGAQAVCGSIDDVAEELAARLVAIGGVDRLLVQTDNASFPFAEVVASMERLARRVLPQVAERLAAATVASPTPTPTPAR
jgi:alkanesulfonate monooxygenase SsuD/methylene tetrahydromethanopterin reductase-like flavin-dependent oxidoreductase (luciferase family)